MRNLTYSLVALVALSLTALAAGVMNGSTWRNSTGTHSVTVGLEAQTSGNYKVTFTEGTNSGSTDWGTPDPNGGVAECPAVGVDGESYRVKDKGSYSVVQWKNAAGLWIDLHQPPKPKDGTALDQYMSGDGTIGSLPYSATAFGDDTIGSLPLAFGDETIGGLPLMADDETVGTLP